MHHYQGLATHNGADQRDAADHRCHCPLKVVIILAVLLSLLLVMFIAPS